APARKTNRLPEPATGCGWNPTDERICGQAPRSSLRMVKERGLEALQLTASSSTVARPFNLISKCIPETRAHIEAIRPAPIAHVVSGGASQEVHGEQQRARHSCPAEPYARTELNKIGPILAFDIRRQIGVPVDLGFAIRPEAPCSRREFAYMSGNRH